MEKFIEKTGRSTDDAIAAALAELHLEREDVTVEVLQLPKTGFLGFGAAPAVVRVGYQIPDEPAPAPVKAPKEDLAEKKEKPAPAEKPVKAEKPAKAEKPVKAEMPASAPVDEEAEFAGIRAFLTGLLEHMGVSAQIQIARRDNGGIGVNLVGDNMGAIIRMSQLHFINEII